MRLEKLHVYKVIRILRVVVPIVVVVLIAIPVVEFVTRPVGNGAGEGRLRLVQDMSDLTEQFTYSVAEGGRTSFTVEGMRYLGFRDGKSLGEDVDVVLYEDDGRTPAHRIHGDRCDYDQEDQNIRCYGNVVVRFDERTTGRTHSVEYDHVLRTITTLTPAMVVRSGEFEGRAERVRFDMAPDVIHMEGAAEVVYEDGTRLSAGVARHHQREQRVEASGGLHVESARLDVTAGEAVLRFAGDPPEPSDLEAWGGVVVVSREDGMRLTSNRSRLRIEAGRIEDLTAQGGAVLQSPDGRSLSGVLMHGRYDDGRLTRVEVEENGQMALPGGDLLESGRILYEPAGAVVTAGPSRLQVGRWMVQGADFTIRESEVVTFQTTRPARIESPDTVASGRETMARFEPQSKQLLELVQTGDAVFEQSERRGGADRIEVSSGGEQILLDGAAHVEDPRSRIDGERIVLLNAEGAFTAEGAVRAVTSGEGQRLFVVSRTAVGGASSVRFEGGAELWRGDAYVSAERIDIALETRGFTAEGAVSSTVGELRAGSDRMVFDEAAHEVHYSGNARLRSRDLEVWADDLAAVIGQDEPERITARGEVRLRRGDIEGGGQEAVYTRPDEVVTLTGSEAWVSSPQDGTLRGGSLRLELATESVTALGASGGRVISSRTLQP